MSTSNKHHFVPQWYQKGFLRDEDTQLWILDKNPDRFAKPAGGFNIAKSVLHRGPGASFFERHLYTVAAFGVRNDEIETHLFGSIDTEGAAAISAFLASDWNKIHTSYRHVFEFMDALRLRTPKGLRWLKKVSEANSQLQLMIIMQELRTMHCVMWVEGVLEIVSARNAQRKFIFSDHPVTFFNRHVFPVSASGKSSEDPPLEWIGTQTLFPFDRDNLFVLTHLEGAKGAVGAAASQTRTNARYFDNPVVRYDKCLRGRELTESQVAEVNYIIKQRADRYIAAGTEDELYPEKYLANRMWPKLGKFLLPPRQAMWKTGGEIFMMKADGTFINQDAFGRQPATKEALMAKRAQAEAMEKRMRELLAAERLKKQAT